MTFTRLNANTLTFIIHRIVSVHILTYTVYEYVFMYILLTKAIGKRYALYATEFVNRDNDVNMPTQILDWPQDKNKSILILRFIIKLLCFFFLLIYECTLRNPRNEIIRISAPNCARYRGFATSWNSSTCSSPKSTNKEDLSTSKFILTLLRFIEKKKNKRYVNKAFVASA